MLPSIVLALGIVWMSARSKVIMYIVEVDNLAATVFRNRAQEGRKGRRRGSPNGPNPYRRVASAVVVSPLRLITRAARRFTVHRWTSSDRPAGIRVCVIA